MSPALDALSIGDHLSALSLNSSAERTGKVSEHVISTRNQSGYYRLYAVPLKCQIRAGLLSRHVEENNIALATMAITFVRGLARQ